MLQVLVQRSHVVVWCGVAWCDLSTSSSSNQSFFNITALLIFCFLLPFYLYIFFLDCIFSYLLQSSQSLFHLIFFNFYFSFSPSLFSPTLISHYHHLNDTGVPSSNYESFQVLKYDIGQAYGAHHDFGGG